MANGGSAPRMLCLDDYFMTEVEKTVRDPDSGKMVKKTVSCDKDHMDFGNLDNLLFPKSCNHDFKHVIFTYVLRIDMSIFCENTPGWILLNFIDDNLKIDSGTRIKINFTDLMLLLNKQVSKLITVKPLI